MTEVSNDDDDDADYGDVDENDDDNNGDDEVRERTKGIGHMMWFGEKCYKKRSNYDRQL